MDQHITTTVPIPSATPPTTTTSLPTTTPRQRPTTITTTIRHTKPVVTTPRTTPTLTSKDINHSYSAHLIQLPRNARELNQTNPDWTAIMAHLQKNVTTDLYKAILTANYALSKSGTTVWQSICDAYNTKMAIFQSLKHSSNRSHARIPQSL